MNETQNKIQEIFIYMDDSGKLTKKELFCGYGGLIFLSNQEKSKFASKYSNIINDIKCSYCNQNKTNCNKKCVEIKSYLIKKSHRRRILNLCKQYHTFAIIIKNKEVYNSIMNNKASKGRFIDYTQKVAFKKIIQTLIDKKVIDPNEEVKLMINIDQQTTKSNGYYTLKDGIYEELIHGINNYDYSIKYKPILKYLTLEIKYIDSKKNALIQASDIIAGTVRKTLVNLQFPFNEKIEKINTIITNHYLFP